MVAIDNAFLACDQPDFTVSEWRDIGVKMVLYWSLPLFAAMKAVTGVVRTLKEKGTAAGMKNELFSYEE